jgi:hypothetical protein
MTHARTMAFRLIGDLFCVAHSAAPPSDAEWNLYVDALKRMDPTRVRTLVFTLGGGPSADQRERVNSLLKGRATLVAVVTDSVWVRVIVRALSWKNPMIQAFSSSELDKVWRHLKMSPADIATAARELAELRREVGAGS